MELFLIRHAEAVALGERGITDDALRPLTEKGEQQSQRVAEGLRRRDIQLDKLVTSPLVRARQTADIILKYWNGPVPELVEWDGLADIRPRKLARFLLKQSGERIGLVGHAPSINDFCGWLIGNKKAQIDIAKAGVAHLSCESVAGKGT